MLAEALNRNSDWIKRNRAGLACVLLAPILALIFFFPIVIGCASALLIIGLQIIPYPEGYRRHLLDTVIISLALS